MLVGPAPVDAQWVGSNPIRCSLLGCGAGDDDRGHDVQSADNDVHPMTVDGGHDHSLNHGVDADVSDVQVALHTTRVGQSPVNRSIDRCRPGLARRRHGGASAYGCHAAQFAGPSTDYAGGNARNDDGGAIDAGPCGHASETNIAATGPDRH